MNIALKANWFGGIIGSTVIAYILMFLISLFPAYIWSQPYFSVFLCVLMAILFACLLIPVFLPGRYKQERNLLVILMLSVFFSTTLFFMLHPLDYGINGNSGDALYITASIQQYAHSWKLTDYFYTNLPAYYPPLYFYILGRLSHFTGISTHIMRNVGLVHVGLLAPFLLYGLWKKIVPSTQAVFITFAVVGLTSYEFFLKPYEFLSFTLFVPWWLYYVEDVSQQKPAGRDWTFCTVGSLIGAVLFCTHYYPFFIGLIYLIIIPVFQFRTQFFTHRFKILSGTALLSAIYWAPLFLSFFRRGMESYKNWWFRPGLAKFPFPYLEFNWKGIILLVGFMGLFFLWEKTLEKALGFFCISVYIWTLLGFFGFFTGTPNLYHKSWYLLHDLLLVSFVLSCFYVYRRWSHLFSAHKVSILFLIGWVFFVQSWLVDFHRSKKYQKALHANPRQQVLAVVDSLPCSPNCVILTNVWSVFAHRPLRSFISSNALYSHPAGLFKQRLTVLESVFTSTNSKRALSKLNTNQFPQIEIMILKNKNKQLYWNVFVNDFPYTYQGRNYYIPRSLFSEPYFEQTRYKDFTVIRPRYNKLTKS
ncbi:MAG: arabinofuranosyltransferase [bacterium]